MKMNAMKLSGKSPLWTILLALSLATPVLAGDKKKGTSKNPYTLTELAENIDELQKKKIVLSSKIIGSCKSGCKMWVADGKYKEGNLFALVRAKDDAFKFETDAAGKPVELTGFAVAKLLDFCADKDGEKAEGKEGKTECAGPEGSKKEITFFVTKVKYGK